ncbi:hypothetical protein HGRIS_002209 [Hohenbuehelia grisea]|uniref:Pyrrolidone-carboxylate peptidase n=1 Tax=Hohenbuehelia grisea TaxID=104357 RepID=A0ABR3JK11_9AGAR
MVRFFATIALLSAALQAVAAPGPSQGTYRVLLTGFGPFEGFPVNPAWLAVQPLQNMVIDLGAGNASQAAPGRRSVHISALQIPVTYDGVLSIVPGLHARPPVLPRPVGPNFPPPPPEGYDLAFHVGVWPKGGPMRMEHLGHKLGYWAPDAEGKYAPTVRTSQGEDRGFVGPRYQRFPSEMNTDIDVRSLVQSLKQSGIQQIQESWDPERYLCDFIYYCSLAESARNALPMRKKTLVQFLHIPPINQPLATKDVTEAIKRSIVWIARNTN